MPIIQGTRRIDPLDLGEEIFIGVALPLNEVTMFTGTTTQKEQIRTNQYSKPKPRKYRKKA